jgi:hypothetical protein
VSEGQRPIVRPHVSDIEAEARLREALEDRHEILDRSAEGPHDR